MSATAPVKYATVRFFVNLEEILQSHGADNARLSQVSGISEDTFKTQTSYITHTEGQNYIHAVRELTGREDLGFELGRRIRMNQNGPLGYGLISSTSMHDFYVMQSRYYHLMTTFWTMHYKRTYSGGEAVFLPNAAHNRDTHLFMMEVISMGQQNQTHLMMGGREPAYDIHLGMPAPPHRHHYQSLSPVRFHFHENASPCVRIVMGNNLLNAPLALGDPVVMREVAERCGLITPQVANTDICWADHVSSMLRDAPGMQLSLEDLARHIRVSARTIDRHLKNEGVGFRELSDKVRFERACTLLSEEGSSVVGVAEQMGFSDAANFSRAFKRVMGVSPSDYQRGDR